MKNSKISNSVNNQTLNNIFQKTGNTVLLNTNSLGTNKSETETSGLFTKAELNQIMTANSIGLWKFNMLTNQVNLCPLAANLLGVKNCLTINLSTVLRQMVKINATQVLVSLRAACRAQTRIEEVVNIKNTKNGNDQWLKVTGTTLYHNGLAFQMMGTITDITVLKNDENRRMDLMAFLSHELRTPLSTVKLYIQSAYKQVKADSNYNLANRLIKADQQTVCMTNMIDNFLNLSCMEVTRLVIQTTTFNLNKLVDELIAETAFLYPDRIFKITLAKPVTIQADREKITQVIRNYLTNAVKYSPTNSTILISCKQFGNKVNFAVHDKGAGISTADQKLLFNRYSRVHNQNTIRAKGFGLGLFLSRQIIEAHRGKIWVKSRLNEGSVFGFTLLLTKDIS